MSYIEPTKRELKMEHCFANSLEIDMEHISIPEGISDKLKGKTIEKTSLHTNMNHSDENHLVITFTDGTYISVVIEYDNNYYLDQYIPALSCYDADDVGYVSGDEFHYRKYFKQLIDIGAVKPLDENILKEKILERNMKDELRDMSYWDYHTSNMDGTIIGERFDNPIRISITKQYNPEFTQEIDEEALIEQARQEFLEDLDKTNEK